MMSEINPYASPQVPSENTGAIESELVVDEELLLDAAVAEKRFRRGVIGRTAGICLFLGFVALILTWLTVIWLVQLEIISPPDSNALYVGTFSSILCGGAVGYFTARARRRKFREESQRELTELRAADSRLEFGLWYGHLNQERLLLMTPGGTWSWPVVDLRRLAIAEFQKNLDKALFVKTPLFLLPIPPRRIHRDTFRLLSAAITANITEEIVEKQWFQI